MEADVAGNIAIARTFLEELPQGAFRLLGPTGTFTIVGSEPWGGTQGRDEMVASFAALAALSAEPMTMTPMVFTAQDDRVSVVARGQWRLKNGKVHDTEYHFLFTIADGQVQAVREYSDLSRAADLFGDGAAG